jgi:hypothetical protein
MKTIGKIQGLMMAFLLVGAVLFIDLVCFISKIKKVAARKFKH